MSDYRVKAQCPVVDCEGVIITGICPVCGLKTPPMKLCGVKGVIWLL
jgi:hypothetical protein